MAAKFVFEDSEEIPGSRLLLKCFNHKNIFFSNGNTLLWATTMKQYNEHDYFFLFMDTVPDNRRVMALYHKIYNQVRKYKNIYLIPIPCMEYILIDFFVKYGYIENISEEIQQLIDMLVSDFKWKLIPAEIKRKGNIRYTERAFKYILNNVNPCLRNIADPFRPQYGKIYTRDCACPQCRHNGDSVLLKAERLYMQLPYHEVIEKEHIHLLEKYGLYTESISLNALYDSCRFLFNTICDELNMPHIPLAILKE